MIPAPSSNFSGFPKAPATIQKPAFSLWCPLYPKVRNNPEGIKYAEECWVPCPGDPGGIKFAEELGVAL
jgi:hypothetical protein